MLQNSSASDHESSRQTQAGSSRENFQSRNKAPSYSSLVKNPDLKQSQYRSTTNFVEHTRTLGAAHSMELTQNSELYEGDQQVNPNPWQTVQRKPKRQIVRGSRGSSSILKGVQENKYLYVGRCDPKVSTDDIMKYMRDEIDVEPLNCDVIAKPNIPVKSFRINVAASDIKTLLVPDAWPENICVRMYVNRSHTGNFFNDPNGA